ncbi:MAG: exported protein of unknown function [Candidatus Saccharibacteria bacterium]|nr:exported protein of unknown function [Candidatus Saccharibacteria bacterium]
MKLSRLFNNLPKRLATAAILALAFTFPVAASAAQAVTIEGSMGVANVTAGDTQYQHNVNASYNQVVKLQVYYHNRENPDSGKIAENVRVKIDIPTTAGKTQTQTATISSDNSNTVTSQTTVNLDRSDAYLQYIPGTAVWRHNTGTNDNLNIVNTTVSDAIVTSGQGLVLEDEKPCYNFAATVTVMARVMVPGTKVVKQVQKASETGKWATTNTANPGDTLKYMITYENTGNTTAKNVIVRDNLPPNMTYVKGTTVVTNSNNPTGAKDTTDAVTVNGILIGDYAPGAKAYVVIQVKVADAAKLVCGNTRFTNVGIAHPKGTPEYYNTAYTDVNKKCDTTPSTPVYTCDAFTLTPGADRKVTAKVTKYTATNGATLKTVTYDFGDGSAPATRNYGTAVDHTYAKAGNYTVTTSLLFSVNGTDKVVKSQTCAKPVSFTTGTPVAPTELPHTGPGDMIALFAGTSLVAAIAHRLFARRRVSL